jgi:iron-sulfur cluster assembly protein
MFTVTERAAKKAVDMAKKQGKPPILRVGVRAGGCHGMSHVREFIAAPRDFDHCWEVAGLQVVCDPKSYNILAKMTLDYEPHLLRAGFRYLTEEAKRSCSCGESFAV